MIIRTYLYLFIVLGLIFSCDNRKLPVPVYVPSFQFSPENGVIEAGKEFSFNLKILKDTTEGYPDNIEHGLAIEVNPIFTEDEIKANPDYFRKYSLSFVVNEGSANNFVQNSEIVPLKEDNLIKLTKNEKGNYLLLLKVINNPPYSGVKIDTLFLTVE